MSWYRRIYRSGGTFFFTLVTEGRARILCEEVARGMLHEAINRCRATRPFTIDAIVLLPDHLHMIMTLPQDDVEYSTRLSIIKRRFTRAWLANGGEERARSASRLRQRRRGVWQRKFWEHTIRDTDDLERHLDYIRYNPIKHGLAQCAHEWPHSSFARHVGRSIYRPDWQCRCDGRTPAPETFDDMGDLELE